MHKLKIEMTGPGRGRVWLDDFELIATAVAVDFRAGKMNVAKLEVNVLECNVTGEVDVEMVVDVLQKTTLHVSSGK
jgi:hypothetical protein